MKIAMIGTGYVGLVSGVCFSDFGHDVVCVDKNPDKIGMLKRGEVPIYEPGLNTLMAKNVAARTAVEVSEEAIQLMGGYGYLLENEVERFYRDVKLCEIGEGTSEVQRIVISRNLLGR